MGIKGQLSINSSDGGTIEFYLEDCTPQYLPAEYEQQPVLDADGNAVVDADGKPVTKKVAVKDSRIETLEEAVRRCIMSELVLDELTQTLTSATVEISYVVQGSVTLELDEDDLSEYTDGELSEYQVEQDFNDRIEELVADDISSGFGWGAYLQFSIESLDVE